MMNKLYSKIRMLATLWHNNKKRILIKGRTGYRQRNEFDTKPYKGLERYSILNSRKTWSEGG